MQKVKSQPKYTLFTAKALAFLIIPICIESALSMSLGMIDGLMASYAKSGAGDDILTAITDVDQISSLIIQLFVAFGVGGAVITSQYLGAGKVEEANKSAKQLIVIMLILSLGLMGISLALNHQIINLLFGSSGGNTLKNAYIYFYIIAASFPFVAVFNSCAALLRAQRKSMNTMLSGIISFFLNIAFNAIFIYGFKLGIAGVALGTLLARIFPAFFTLFLLTRKGNVVRIKIFEKFRFDGEKIKRILKLAVPSGIENSLFQLGKILVIVFISIASYNVFLDGNSLNLSPDNITNYQTAANSVAYNINTISSIVGNGINTAILTVIGQAVGTGNIGQVKYYIRKMLAISYVGNACCVAVTFALSPVLLNFYNISGAARGYAWKCLLLCLPLQFVTYPLSFGLPAVLKANSDMKFVMVAAVTSMLLMRVGLCYILTCDWVGAHLGALGLWIGMVSDWGFRGLLFGGRLISGRWKKSSGLLNGPDYGEPERIAEEEVAAIFNGDKNV
ncbi:MAG: polysaccharide biosynthesis C-terminal domain-containing protein [Clostridia bacterium]|nr:polysaccharide biosynthesis C-terminal domain-containing protein [Clostridia bacterium]